VNSRQRRTLGQIFCEPVPADLAWREIETLLRALGAEVTEGSGSRVRIARRGVRAVLHRPHPAPEADRATVRAVRALLEAAGANPKGEADA